MKYFYYLLIFVLFNICSCALEKGYKALPKNEINDFSGYDFYRKVVAYDPEEREAQIEKAFISSNFPDFLRRFTPIKVSITTENNEVIHATYYVMPDYLSIGNNRNFFRIPMQPKTAQKIADAFDCFLSTSKICDDVYKVAQVKLAPYPLTENRNSFTTFYFHNQIIEKQRKGRKGLIAGIKKDVILSSAINKDVRPNRVAIYGWHKLDGEPIQPIYTGHVDWYVDYSHGIRLVHKIIYVDNKPMNYIEVLKDPILRLLLSNEDEEFDFFSY